MASANAMLPFGVQALRYVQQAIDSGVIHASLFYLKGELLYLRVDPLVDNTAAPYPMQALAAYKESHSLRPSWRAMMGCAKAAFAANKRHEVRTRLTPQIAALGEPAREAEAAHRVLGEEDRPCCQGVHLQESGKT